MTDYKKLFKYSFTCLLVLFLIGCESREDQDKKEHIYTGGAFGTTYQFKFYHHSEINIETDLDSIFNVINQSMSTYIPQSDISRINAGDTGVVVDQHFRNVMEISLKIYRESEGYFDPTVGKLVNAYGFGSEAFRTYPARSTTDSLKQYVGLDKVKLTDNNLLQKQDPAIYLEFNAIAKGYAVDVVARYLDNRNVENYLLEIGGELVAKGINLGRDQPWVVGIDKPQAEDGSGRPLQVAIELKDRAMATSGNYRKFREDPATGQAYVHTINPLTGLAEKSNILSATVLAENCALADGYATAFMAMGLERSQTMLEDVTGVDVLFIYFEDKEIKTFTSKGFEEALLED